MVSLPAVVEASGRLILPAKLVEGIASFAALWPGDVLTLLDQTATPTNSLDNRSWAPEELPGRVEIVDFRALSKHGRPDLHDAMVLSFVDHRLHGFVAWCRRRAVPCVLFTELTLRTQFQILWAEHRSWRVRASTGSWLLFNHARTLLTVARASALQCNGTPTFDAYRALARDALLYFDTRTTTAMMAAPAEVETRLSDRARQRTIRLLFSGRLVEIKGVLDLVKVAGRLHGAGLDFHLSIAGTGPLRERIESDIVAAGLQSVVRCLGTLDFSTELTPLLRREIDLFVCPHLQGDPACTYLETMAAGVPIVGYANEAFKGVQRVSGSGWQVPLGRPVDLADEIVRIAGHPEELKAHSLAALAFAAKHSFESEFRRRTDHLLAVAARAEDGAAGSRSQARP